MSLHADRQRDPSAPVVERHGHCARPARHGRVLRGRVRPHRRIASTFAGFRRAPRRLPARDGVPTTWSRSKATTSARSASSSTRPRSPGARISIPLTGRRRRDARCSSPRDDRAPGRGASAAVQKFRSASRRSRPRANGSCSGSSPPGGGLGLLTTRVFWPRWDCCSSWSRSRLLDPGSTGGTAAGEPCRSPCGAPAPGARGADPGGGRVFVAVDRWARSRGGAAPDRRARATSSTRSSCGATCSSRPPPVLLVLAALVLGVAAGQPRPRNVIAYVAFFEAGAEASRIMPTTSSVRDTCERRDRAIPRTASGGRAAAHHAGPRQAFSPCVNARSVPAEPKRESKEEAHAKPAGAPA